MPDKLDDLVSKVSGSQPSRTAANGKPTDASMDLVNQVLNNLKQQEQLTKAQSEINTPRDNMTSIPGLLGLLGTGVAAATNHPDIANGLLSGTIGGAEDKSARENASMNNALEAAKSSLSASRQQISTMINTNPNMFVDPETGESTVDPRLLGYLSTGMLLPVDPGANYMIKRNAKERTDRIDFATNLMRTGDTQAERDRGAVMINNLLHLNLTSEGVAELGMKADLDLFEALLNNPQLDPISVIRAKNYQDSEPEKKFTDGDVLSMIQQKQDSTFRLQKHQQELLAKFSVKLLDSPDPELRNQPMDVQLSYAFADSPGEEAEMKKYFLGNNAFGSGVSSGQLLSATMSNVGLLTFLLSTIPDSPILKDNNIKSRDDAANFATKNVGSFLGPIKELQALEAGKAISNDIRTISGAYSSTGTPSDVASSWALVAVLKAKREATSETGILDVELYRKKIEELQEKIKAESTTSSGGE